MTHVHHQSLPDYRPEAVLQDGCPTCEARTTLSGFCHLDDRNLRLLWLQRIKDEHASRADAEACHTLYLVGVLVERLEAICGGVRPPC